MASESTSASSHTSQPKYYVVEDGIPLPRRQNLASAINSLKDGQSFTVPDKDERMRALSLARARKVKLVSQKLKPSEGEGYRIWRAASKL